MAAVAVAPAFAAAVNNRTAVSSAEARLAGARPALRRAVRGYFTAIADGGSSLGSLKRAYTLYSLATDPTRGLIGPILGMDADYKVPDVGTLLGPLGLRAAHVDAELSRFLDGARINADGAADDLAALPEQLRALVALRFYALGAWDVCLAAENVQSGLETVLDEEAYDEHADDRDASVDDFGTAMDVLRDTLPSSDVFQAALDALLAGGAVPTECAESFEGMTDDCILPEMDWLRDVEAAEDEMDEEEE